MAGEIRKFRVTINKGEHVESFTVSINGEETKEYTENYSQKIAKGAEVTITAKPENGYSVIEGSGSFNVNDNTTREIKAEDNFKIYNLKFSGPILNGNNNNIIQNEFLNNFSGRWGTRNWYYAFDGNNSTSTTTYSAGNNAIGSFLGYDFEKPILITKVTGKIRMYSYKIQYSDDNIKYFDATIGKLNGSEYGDAFSTTFNCGPHRYWRLYVNGGQRQSDWSAYIWSLKFEGFSKN